MATTELTAANFDKVVNGADKPVLVDFWASWCGPCRMVSPIVEEMGEDLSDKMEVCKLNVDDAQDIAAKFQVMSIPTLILFKDGKPVHTTVGAQSRQDLEKEFEPYL